MVRDTWGSFFGFERKPGDVEDDTLRARIAQARHLTCYDLSISEVSVLLFASPNSHLVRGSILHDLDLLLHTLW